MIWNPKSAFIAGFMGFALASQAGAAELSSQAAQGQAFAEANCAACHATGQTGDSPLDQAPPLRTLSGLYPIDNLAEAFAEGIVTGHPGMPEFELPPEGIDALLAYLTSIQDPAN